jgi:hypothetical protein
MPLTTRPIFHRVPRHHQHRHALLPVASNPHSQTPNHIFGLLDQQRASSLSGSPGARSLRALKQTPPAVPILARLLTLRRGEEPSVDLAHHGIRLYTAT